jgi:hypothetical protein
MVQKQVMEHAYLMASSLLSESIPDSRKLLVSASTRYLPEFVRQLNEWQYLERTIHRLMAAWGRHHREIEDKAALHRHIWDQAEVIRRLRERIDQFPGGKPDGMVHPAFEGLANAVLLAPSFHDALDAIYHYLPRALVRAYAEHVQNAHPVHDAPTIALLHEINTIKEQHHFWYRAYRQRHPHATDTTYRERLEATLPALNYFCQPMPAFEGEGAAQCGVRTSFVLPRCSGRPQDWKSRYDIMPYISADFSENVETRRLFWAIGYLNEINLPDDQLRWLYYGHYMPWDWHHTISRHLWDESRHGLSGLYRLREWNIPLSDVGLPPYDKTGRRMFPEGAPLTERVLNPFEEETDFLTPGVPMSPQELYEQVFFIGMVAENGHFIVKNEAYDDFRKGEDFESAEMMLFDIIDETTHVQYAHRWLPFLAQHAGCDIAGYRERAVQARAQIQREEMQRIEEAATLPRDASFGPWNHYQELLKKIRSATPFLPSFQPARRSPKPM